MSDSEPVINKNKLHRKDKREYVATIHLFQNSNLFFKHGIPMISTSKWLIHCWKSWLILCNKPSVGIQSRNWTGTEVVLVED